MNKKKQSNISEPTTQPERPRRFSRRNSIHTLHCRSGSLNKLASFDCDPVISEPSPEETLQRPSRRRQTFDVNCSPNLSEFDDSPKLSTKRISGSMQVKSCCRDKLKLQEQYENLKQKYQQRGRQLQTLEEECRKLSIYGFDENNRRKKVE